MSMHLRSGEFVDLAEGGGSVRARRHVETCSQCQGTLAELRGTMAAAGEVGVPEPSPLFWDSQRRRIQQAVAGERFSPEGSWLDRTTRSGVTWLLAAAGVATIVGAVVVSGGRFIGPRAGGPVAPAPTATRLAVEGAEPSVVIDPGEGSLDFVTELAEDVDWSVSSSAPETALVGSLEQEAAQLDAAERRELRRLLEELAHRGA